MAPRALGFKKEILKSRGPRSPKNLRERNSFGGDLPKPSLDKRRAQYRDFSGGFALEVGGCVRGVAMEVERLGRRIGTIPQTPMSKKIKG
jgi:hypothetical protein